MRVKKNRSHIDDTTKLEMEKAETLMKGARNLLSVSQNTIQRLEAEKTMILAQTRLDVLRSRANPRGPVPERRATATKTMSKDSSTLLADISLSDMRIPLTWDPVGLLHDGSSSQVFGVFAIVACQGEVYDTTLLYPVDNQVTDLVFKDVIAFSGVPSNFKINITIYSFDLSPSFNNGVLKFFKGILRGRRNNEGSEWKAFVPFARTSLHLADASDDVGVTKICHDVGGNNVVGDHPQLFGQFCFRLAVKPLLSDDTTFTSCFDVSWPDSEIVMDACFVELSNWKIDVWTSVADRKNQRPPWKQISLDADSKIYKGTSSFWVENAGEDDEQLHFTAKSEDGNPRLWLEKLARTIEEYREWKQAARTKMTVFSPRVKNSPRQYRHLGRKTNSKLMLIYNRISSTNICPPK